VRNFREKVENEFVSRACPEGTRIDEAPSCTEKGRRAPNSHLSTKTRSLGYPSGLRSGLFLDKERARISNYADSHARSTRNQLDSRFGWPTVDFCEIRELRGKEGKIIRRLRDKE